MDHLDRNGQCPLVHAALRGHMEVVKFLIQCDWSQQPSPQSQQQATRVNKSQAVQQALVAAASMGHAEVRLTSRYSARDQQDQQPLEA